MGVLNADTQTPGAPERKWVSEVRNFPTTLHLPRRPPRACTSHPPGVQHGTTKCRQGRYNSTALRRVGEFDRSTDFKGPGEQREAAMEPFQNHLQLRIEVSGGAYLTAADKNRLSRLAWTAQRGLDRAAQRRTTKPVSPRHLMRATADVCQHTERIRKQTRQVTGSPCVQRKEFAYGRRKGVVA